MASEELTPLQAAVAMQELPIEHRNRLIREGVSAGVVIDLRGLFSRAAEDEEHGE